MRTRIITAIYTLTAILEDVAFWVIGKGDDDRERIIKTFWSIHYF